MMKPSPNQAVILCGGLGTRLRPITNTLPKPMVPVNSKPFLFFLLDQLAGQGIKRFILLIGYLGEKIPEYFGNGKKWGWTIDYSSGPAEWDTGRRIWETRDKLDKQFLLLYSDNFVQFNLEKLKQLHKKHCVPISLLLAPKAKGNIRVSETGRIEAYDKSRSREGFAYVEVGYMLIERDSVLTDFPGYKGFPNFNFASLLQKFAVNSQIAGLIMRTPYYSISDPQRLQLMREYLREKKILLIDRDGIINKKAPKGEYITSWDHFEWIPETFQAMKQLSDEGFNFIVITNQAGIARGMINANELNQIHSNMKEEFATAGVTILDIVVCPHHWNDNCSCRKPQPGMLFQSASEYLIRLDHAIFVGDDPRDCQTAYNAGCTSIFIGNSKDINGLNNEEKPLSSFPSMLLSLDTIRNFYCRNQS